MAGHTVLEALDISPAMRVSVNEPRVDFVPGLNGKNFVAILNPQNWVLDKETIEKMFRLGKELREFIK